MSVYLPANLQVSSITLTSFRQAEANSPPPLPPTHTNTPQNKPLKSQPRLELNEKMSKAIAKN